MKGDAHYEQSFEGAIFRFASPGHKDLFAKNPESYVPQYGGFCASGLASGKLAPVDPEAFEMVDGKLYLNYNRDVQTQWHADRARLRKGMRSGPGLNPKPPRNNSRAKRRKGRKVRACVPEELITCRTLSQIESE